MNWYKKAQDEEVDEDLFNIVEEELSNQQWVDAVESVMRNVENYCSGATLIRSMEEVKKDIQLQIETSAKQFPSKWSFQTLEGMGGLMVRRNSVMGAYSAISGKSFSDSYMYMIENNVKMRAWERLFSGRNIKNKDDLEVVKKSLDEQINKDSQLNQVGIAANYAMELLKK